MGKIATDYSITIDQIFAKRKRTTRGDIGLEIELEGSNLVSKSDFKWWTFHQEASLRNGIEYVLVNPIALGDVPDALKEYAKGIETAKFDNSIRTSTHMHVDVSRFSLTEVYAFLAAYYLVENILVDANGKDRKGNLHCLRLSDAEAISHKLLEEISNGNPLQSWTEENRYAAMNLAAIRKFGSVEFRFMKAITNIKELQLWVENLHNLVKRSQYFGDAEKILERYHSQGPRDFLKNFFSNEFIDYLFERKSKPFRVLMEENLIHVSDLVSALRYKVPSVISKRSRPYVFHVQDPDIDQGF